MSSILSSWLPFLSRPRGQEGQTPKAETTGTERGLGDNASFPPGDPRNEYGNVPPPRDVPYPTENEAFSTVSVDRKHSLVAASIRGFDHRYESSVGFRDDSFRIGCVNDWIIVAVSDGAGSCRFARKGADILCATFLSELTKKFSSAETLRTLKRLRKQSFDDYCEQLRRLLCKVLYHGRLAIDDESKIFNENRPADESQSSPKDFGATFLGYVAHREKGRKWMFVSIGVGDGAMAVAEPNGTIHRLNEPDEGEFDGETLFVTADGIQWNEWDFWKPRTKAVVVDSFDYALCMTDGVSNPLFETDAGLADSARWKRAFESLSDPDKLDSPCPVPPVALLPGNASAGKQLARWLEFWINPSYADDRTLVVFH